MIAPTIWCWLVGLCTSTYGYVRFLEWNDIHREAVKVELDDPLLKLFRPVNVSVPVYSLLYVNIALALAENYSQSLETLMSMVEVQVLVVLCRIVTMFLTPLRVKTSVIPMFDPVSELICRVCLPAKHQHHRKEKTESETDAEAYPRPWCDDLFFSGHTSMMCVLFLCCDPANVALQRFHLASTLLIVACMAVSHVHYAIDMFISPFICYTIHSLYTRYCTSSSISAAAAAAAG